MSKNKPATTDQETPAASAIEAEATGAKTLVARWGDQDWIVPATLDEWDADALEAYSALVAAHRAGASDIETFAYSSRVARGVLGPRQWQRWRNGSRTTAKDLSTLTAAIFGAYDEATSGE